MYAALRFASHVDYRRVKFTTVVYDYEVARHIHAGGGTFIDGGGIIAVGGGGTLTGCPGGGGGAIMGTAGTGTPPVGGASANNWCGRSAWDSGFCAANRRSTAHNAYASMHPD